MNTKKLLPKAAGLAVLGLLLAGCSPAADEAPEETTGGSSAGSDTIVVHGGQDGSVEFEVTVDPELAARAEGLLIGDGLSLVTKAGAPPYGFFEDGTQTVRGSDIDLGTAIGAKLGLETEFTVLEFAGIIPGIEANRFDFSIAGMGDTPARQEMVDFVDYSTDSNSIVTTKGNPHDIDGIESLCGLNISSVEGSVYLGLLEQQNESCADKMNITVFQDNASALLQVQTGRADATMYQTGVALYLIKTDEASKNLEVVDSEEYGKGYNAIAFNKDNAELRDLVRDVVEALVDDGVYEAIHLEWGLTSNMIDEITINDGLRFNQPS
jgi:polar amino acid transport system substrate-binding protein